MAERSSPVVARLSLLCIVYLSAHVAEGGLTASQRSVSPDGYRHDEVLSNQGIRSISLRVLPWEWDIDAWFVRRGEKIICAFGTQDVQYDANPAFDPYLAAALRVVFENVNPRSTSTKPDLIVEPYFTKFLCQHIETERSIHLFFEGYVVIKRSDSNVEIDRFEFVHTEKLKDGLSRIREIGLSFLTLGLTSFLPAEFSGTGTARQQARLEAAISNGSNEIASILLARATAYSELLGTPQKLESKERRECLEREREFLALYRREKAGVRGICDYVTGVMSVLANMQRLYDSCEVIDASGEKSTRIDASASKLTTVREKACSKGA